MKNLLIDGSYEERILEFFQNGEKVLQNVDTFLEMGPSKAVVRCLRNTCGY